MKTNEYIILHHSAVSRDKNNEQFDAVKRYHISKKFGDIGYNFFIEPGGQLKIGRSVSSIGAHCKQKLMNYRSIGICLAGDFDKEDPTIEQMEALQGIVTKLMKKYNIPKEKVLAHRKFATYKSCPGNKFTDDMVQSVAKEDAYFNPVSPWAAEAVEWTKKEGIATNFDFPQAPITKETMALMLHRFYKLIKQPCLKEKKHTQE